MQSNLGALHTSHLVSVSEVLLQSSPKLLGGKSREDDDGFGSNGLPLRYAYEDLKGCFSLVVHNGVIGMLYTPELSLRCACGGLIGCFLTRCSHLLAWYGRGCDAM
ncbi:unnamed protein product [Vicia faba]|uniref:Uncharacterized protein n=1 Tax=Vicia faba TaxID=3906 RepID=A0AAV0YAA4_VICFA|nr:unnamed protein product [Vicia faba]